MAPNMTKKNKPDAGKKISKKTLRYNKLKGNEIRGLPTKIAWLARPGMVNVEVVPGPHFYDSGFAGQLEGFGYKLVRMTKSIAMDWAREALPENHDGKLPCDMAWNGGWSPSRSLIVRRKKLVGDQWQQEELYYKAGDLEMGKRWFDLQLKSPEKCETVERKPMLAAMKLFGLCAVSVARHRGLSMDLVKNMMRHEMKIGFIHFDKKAQDEILACLNPYM